jgi:protein TonB
LQVQLQNRPKVRSRCLANKHRVSSIVLSALLHGVAIVWLVQVARSMPDPRPLLVQEPVTQSPTHIDMVLQDADPTPLFTERPERPPTILEPEFAPLEFEPERESLPEPELEPPRRPTIALFEPSKPNLQKLMTKLPSPVAAPPPDPVPSAVSPIRPLEEVNIKPLYPRAARLRGWEGRVLLEVQVNAEGGASEVKVKESSGHDILDRAAVQAVEKWKFEPAIVAGRPVPGVLLIPVLFKLEP